MRIAVPDPARGRGLCVRHSRPRAGATRVLLCLLAVLAGCATPESGPTAEKFVETREVMGTWATVTLVTDNGKRAVAASDAAFACLDSVNALMNPRWETSEIFAVNDRGTREPVRVSAPTFTVLEQSLRMFALSGGAFDVTVGPLIALWQEHGRAGTVPTEEEIRAARALVGPAQLVLDAAGSTAALHVPGARVDLGGIAKGYAIDLAVDAIRREGVESGIVEAGGDLRCFGTIPAALIGREADQPVRALRNRPIRPRPEQGTGGGAETVFQGLRRSEGAPMADPQPWPLGVQDPFAERLLGRIRVRDQAVATSGHYRRFVTIGGRRYSHILDPRTGRPVEDPASVTVIAGNALEADGLATAITVLGAVRGLALAESLPGVEALIVTGGADDPRVVKTSGFPEMEPIP